MQHIHNSRYSPPKGAVDLIVFNISSPCGKKKISKFEDQTKHVWINKYRGIASSTGAGPAGWSPQNGEGV